MGRGRIPRVIYAIATKGLSRLILHRSSSSQEEDNAIVDQESAVLLQPAIPEPNELLSPVDPTTAASTVPPLVSLNPEDEIDPVLSCYHLLSFKPKLRRLGTPVFCC